MAKIYIPDGQGNYIPFPVLKGDKGDKGDKGQDGADVEFAVIDGFLCYKYAEDELWNQLVSIYELTGPKGDTGTVFVPSIDDLGNLSWSNDAGLPNPPDINIIGKQGVAGNDGMQGEPGENGADGYTPIKGLDYFTPEEIESIASSIETRVKEYVDQLIEQYHPAPPIEPEEI